VAGCWNADCDFPAKGGMIRHEIGCVVQNTAGGRVVTALEEAQGLLSRFDCVYLGYITKGVPAGALAGCYEPTAQVLLYSYAR
jgi:hypothetical protein